VVHHQHQTEVLISAHDTHVDQRAQAI
jgi:hypothetical protein